MTLWVAMQLLVARPGYGDVAVTRPSGVARLQPELAVLVHRDGAGVSLGPAFRAGTQFQVSRLACVGTGAGYAWLDRPDGAHPHWLETMLNVGICSARRDRVRLTLLGGGGYVGYGGRDVWVHSVGFGFSGGFTLRGWRDLWQGLAIRARFAEPGRYIGAAYTVDVGFGEWAPAALRARHPAGAHARSAPGREDVLKRGTRIGAIVGGLAAFVPAVLIYSDRMRARRDCPVDDDACVDRALTRNAVGALFVVIGTGAGAGAGLSLGAGLAQLRWRLTQRRALPDSGERGCAEPSRRAAVDLVDLAPTPNTDRDGSACLREAR